MTTWQNEGIMSAVFTWVSVVATYPPTSGDLKTEVVLLSLCFLKLRLSSSVLALPGYDILLILNNLSHEFLLL